MRTEKEMFNLILNIAKDDERICAVLMNGSRVNPNAIKDIFQDYDIVYVVKETKSFREQKDWIDQFGERLYMQYPEGNSYYENDVENCYGWLIQFTDGNRLDLHVYTLSNGNVKDIWESVFIMCDLFNDIAKDVACKMDINYNEIEANNSLKFLKDVYVLPKDAKEIYE